MTVKKSARSMRLVHETVSHENASQLDEARAWVERESGNADVEVRAADLSLMSGARGLADAIVRDHDHLDVLVNNAGAQFGGERRETAEGHERTFAINMLAPFLLTNLLLPLLEQSSSARVVTVSSESYRQAGRPALGGTVRSSTLSSRAATPWRAPTAAPSSTRGGSCARSIAICVSAESPT